MVKKEILERIYMLLETNQFEFDLDAEKDILKQGYNWSKEFIIECLRKGKIYSGNELYPDVKERHSRYYCIHRQSALSSNLILIGFVILENLLIIHISPLNRGSKEGKVYYNLQDFPLGDFNKPGIRLKKAHESREK